MNELLDEFTFQGLVTNEPSIVFFYDFGGRKKRKTINDSVGATELPNRVHGRRVNRELRDDENGRCENIVMKV